MEILAPVKFNDLSNIGKFQSTGQQANKDQKSRTQNQINLLPSQLNSASLDRFAYVSNCPTSYTDPSGHCDVGHIILGSGFIMLGGYIFTIGTIATAGAIESLQWHLVPLSALGAVSGGLIIFMGLVVLVKDECIPNFIGIK